MDATVPALVLTLTGAVVLLAGAGSLAGRVDPRIAAIASVLAGLALAGVGWLPKPAPPGEEPVTIAAAPLAITADGRRTAIGAVPVPTPPPPLPGREATPLDIEAAEAEPNDTLPGANRARVDVAIDGTLSTGDRDWFAVDIPAGRRGQLVATLVTTDASVTMTLFDDSGQPLGIARTIDEVSVRTATLERAVAGPRYYVLLMPDSEGPARYQLLLATRRW